jgi:sarcosine oxidase gamma subunit
MSLRHRFEPDAIDPGAATSGPVTPGTHFRQGDVLLLAVDPDSLPEKARAVPRQGGRTILAEGEATGHAHAIHSPAATLLRVGSGAEAARFLRTTTPVDLVHEEHAAITLPEGLYAVVIQREYVPPEVSPLAFRRVVD